MAKPGGGAVKLLKRWVLAFVAPKPLVGFIYLPRYFRDWFRYWRTENAGLKPRLNDTYPCLTDWTPNTQFDPHYFYQGAWLARLIHQNAPAVHVDVGSSSLMLSVLSAQVPTIFLDYRPLRARLANLFCVGGSILQLPFEDGALSSISCLHVLEHIGLGRYGDPIDPFGSRRAARELSRVLAPGGRLYVSTPIGRERINFNAHRVFSVDHVENKLFEGLTKIAFAMVDDLGGFHPGANEVSTAQMEYACGMFVFTKL